MQNVADETFRIGQGVCFPAGMRPFEDFFVLVQVCFKLIKKSKTQFYMRNENYNYSIAKQKTWRWTWYSARFLLGSYLYTP